MISLNLISKKKRATKGKNIFSMVLYSVFGLFTLYFVFQVIFVSVNLYLSSNKLNKVRSDSAVLSTQILKDNVKLNNYILSKFILTEITKLRREKFAYKELLNQIVSLMPKGNEVRSVGFEQKGFVAVSIYSTDDNTFRAMESNSKALDLTDTHFSSILVNTVTRSNDGTYRTDFLFRIKTQDAGK